MHPLAHAFRLVREASRIQNGSARAVQPVYSTQSPVSALPTPSQLIMKIGLWSISQLQFSNSLIFYKTNT